MNRGCCKIDERKILHEADVSKFVENAEEIIERNKESRKSKLHQIRKARGFTQKE